MVIATDLSQKYAQEDKKLELEAKASQATELTELEKQKQLYPEDHVIPIECGYSKTEYWEALPESIRPAKGQYGYDVYIPQGYHEADNRAYKCLFLESRSLWDSVKVRIRKEKWIVVILPDAAQQEIGKTMNGNFLAAYDDATRRFRIARDYRFIAGKVPATIFATMRPVAGIILQDPDFTGLKKNNVKLDFLSQSPDLHIYLLLSNRDRENVLFQAQYVIDRIPKHYIEVYEEGAGVQPQVLADRAIDWMKNAYGIY